MFGRRIGLQEGEERLLDREVARVTNRVNIRVSSYLARLHVRGDEAARIDGEGREHGPGHKRRERYEQVVRQRFPVAVLNLALPDLLDAQVRVAHDAVLLELFG